MKKAQPKVKPKPKPTSKDVKLASKQAPVKTAAVGGPRRPPNA